jgi:RNA polymerase sigma factor (sigma-70 family)
MGDPTNGAALETALLRENEKYIWKLAHKFDPLGTIVEDLFQEGCYGLIEAARTFDESRGVKFLTYADWRIRRRMLDFLNHNYTPSLKSSTVRLKAKVAMMRQSGMSDEEITDTLRITPDHLKAIDGLARPPVPLDNYLEYYSRARDRPEMFDDGVALAKTLEALSSVSPRYAFIIKLRLQGWSLRDIGRELGLTPQRIGQLERKARELIRELRDQAP